MRMIAKTILVNGNFSPSTELFLTVFSVHIVATVYAEKWREVNHYVLIPCVLPKKLGF